MQANAAWNYFFLHCPSGIHRLPITHPSQRMQNLTRNQGLPLLSIIVPNYNHASYLRERLQSILSQTYTHTELIILDDSSSDESLQIIEQCLNGHPHKLIVNETNSGSTFLQWDRGIRASTGEYIWIAESDDVAAPTFLETMLAKLEKETEAAMAYCQSIAINERSEPTANLKGWTDFISHQLWARDFCIDGTYFAIHFMALKNIIPNASAVVFRRERYVSPYQLKPDHKLGGDMLLWVSMMHGCSIAYVASPLNYYRFHLGTVRKSRRYQYLNECQMIAVWILDHTAAWEHPQELITLREHLANLWFSIGLEPASIKNWFQYRRAYQLLWRLHGLGLIIILMLRIPQSLWRITLPYRLLWQLGTRSLLLKVQRQLGAGKNQLTQID